MFALALLVLGACWVSAQPAAAAAGVKVDASPFSCGWEASSRTMLPTISVTRTSGSDPQFTARMLLMKGTTQVASLSAGEVQDDGSVAQTGLTSLAVGKSTFVRPWGAKFGDNVGGPPLDPAAAYTINVILYDFSTGENAVVNGLKCPAFQLDSGAWGPYANATAQLETKYPRRSFTQVATAAAAGTAARPGCVEGAAPAPTTSFCWSSADSTDPLWYPQGLAGSGESGAAGGGTWSGVPAGKRYLLATWYKRKTASDENSSTANRVSVVDVSSATPKYVHVDLVDPTQSCATCPGGVAVLTIHAGGAAWTGQYLYVPDTSKGLRVFDLTHFVAVGSGAQTRYLLPQAAFYGQVGCTGAACLSYSYASIDNGATPGRLVVGEYINGKVGARVAWWPIASTGRLQQTGTKVRTVRDDILIAGFHAANSGANKNTVSNLQGIATNNSVYVASKSDGATRQGKLIRTTPGRLPVVKTYGIGPEDLYGSKTYDQLWTLGEHPGKRSVYAVKWTTAFAT